MPNKRNEKKAVVIGVKEFITPALPISIYDNVLYQKNSENPQSQPITKGYIRFSGLSSVFKVSSGKNMK